MIARLVGTLVDREAGWGILDVRGVGYEVFAPVRALDTWAQSDQTVTAHVSTQVREDAFTLYAFTNRRDRDAFRTLLGVSGIGPKIALAPLDNLDVDQLTQAVESDDLLTLSRIPGVGKKSAQRMALELKGKLAADFVPGSKVKGKKASTAGSDDMLPLALARLDYGKTEIDRALHGLSQAGLAPDAPLQERLRMALRILSGDA